MAATNKNIANLIIISSPSGGGKTSLVKKLLTELAGIKISVSHTTRTKRPGEEHGRDYFFISKQDFLNMQKDHIFLEHAEVFDNCYGTSAKTVADNLQSGIDTILEIDWQGARQIKNKLPNAISIFILPPSISVLKDRLYQRNLDNPQVIENRMQKAKAEMSHYHEYDFLVVNDNFEQATQELKTIILSQRLKTTTQESKLMTTIQQLLQ